ncbi:ANKK1 [Symbiodinium pilosum]|uniref:ANKK1 protein n=1 Tax=Symbiodinium pilosum TaxID=2952 RepID=A0A812WXW1_SYMPI|nr:ANKK1 [Symbiodinium pilosum]
MSAAAPARSASKSGDWVGASSDVSMLNERLYNSQRIDTFHTPAKLDPLSPVGVSPERRSPSPTERPSSTPLSFDTRDGQYGHRLMDLVNNWNEDTRRMLREELTLHTRSELAPTPTPIPPDDTAAVQTHLQTILAEVRHLQRESPGCCDHCGALGRVAIAQEELSEIVRGHLILERTSTPQNRNACPTPSTTASDTQATLQKLATELTSAFEEMQKALKGSATLVEDARRLHEQRPSSLDNEPVLHDLQNVKELIGSAAGVSLAADVRDLKESLLLVQQKSEQDSKHLLQQLEHLSDIVAVSCKQDDLPTSQQSQRMLEGLQHVTELISIDHGKAREDAAVVRQSVCVLEAEVCQFKDSVTSSLQQSTEEMMRRLRALEEMISTNQQNAQQKTALQLETVDQNVQLQSSAVAAVKQDVLTVKDHVLQCEERLQKAPRQADLTAAVRRTFEEMSQEFHTECKQLYMKPSFQVSFPDSLNQDLREIKDAVEVERREREQSTVASSAEFSSLAQEVQKMGQGVQGLEVTITERVISEMQHVQDIFAMLESNFLGVVRNQLDKATTAFSSTTSTFRSGLKRELETMIKDATKLQAKQHPTSYAADEPEDTTHSCKMIEAVFACFSAFEFCLLVASALLELQQTDRFIPAIAIVLGPYLLNCVVVLLFFFLLTDALARWMRQNWGHAQRLLALAILRPDWLRVFSLYAPQLRWAPGAWEQRRWQDAVRQRTALLQQECDELKLMVDSEVRLKDQLIAELGKAGGGPDFEACRPEVTALHEPHHGMRPPAAHAHAAHARHLSQSQQEGMVADSLMSSAPLRSTSIPGAPGAAPPTSPLRNREWDGWLRTHSRQEALRSPRGTPGSRLSPGRGSNGQALSVVPSSASRKAPQGVTAASRRILPEAEILPHSCLLCGLAPMNAPKRTASQYSIFMCVTTLAFALYSELPKVWVTVILMSQSWEPVSAVLRLPIIAINGLYLLWSVLLVSRHLLSWFGFRRATPLHTSQPTMIRVSANVSALDDAVVVQWQPPAVPKQGLEPDEFLCAIYHGLGGNDPERPLQLQRVPASRVDPETGGFQCCFADLCPEAAYVVLLTAAHSGLGLGEPARLPCRTLPRVLPAIPDSLIVRSSGPTWVELTWEEPCELLLEISSEASRRTELAWPPVHLEGLRPNTEYAVAVSTLREHHRPVPKLSFVTPQEDQQGFGMMSSVTAVLKDLGNIKESVGAIHAAAANAEVLRHLGALQDRWASLQVSCLTEEIQKLLAANEQLRKDVSTDLKPVLSELQDIHQTLSRSLP